jgi:iron complex outermembrane receptor protein
LVTQTDEQIAPISSFVGFEGNLISQALQWNPTHALIKPGTDSAWIDPAVGSTTVNHLHSYDISTIKPELIRLSPAYLLLIRSQKNWNINSFTASTGRSA